MSAQQVLCQYVDKYVQLSSRYGPDSEQVAEFFGTLKDLLLVELYFMKSVRLIVMEEELSGFVLYIENKLKDIVDSYKPGKNTFMTYFKHVMEYRALSYLAEIRKSNMTAYAYENYYISFVEEVAENSPEDAYMNGLESLEIQRKRKKLRDKIRYVCSLKPSRRRNLFIFLCTLLPYLSYDAVDDFCRTLNCDRDQTFAIADYLSTVQSNKDAIRGRRVYNQSRKDYFWMRKMEMEIELELDCSDTSDERLSSDICRIRNMISNIDAERGKMNVEYPVLGRLLNLEPSSIACAVFSSRKLLSAVLGERSPDSYIAKEARSASGKGRVKLDRFEPFAVFGISMIKRKQGYADAS